MECCFKVKFLQNLVAVQRVPLQHGENSFFMEHVNFVSSCILTIMYLSQW